MPEESGPPTEPGPPDINELLARVALGDRHAFAELYDLTAPKVLGLVRRCLIDPHQSEEVTQEVYLEVWEGATRFDADRGKGITWIMTVAHRRAIDRVRASQSSRDRDLRIGIRDRDTEFDHVSETVEISMEHQRALAALASLTEIQQQAVKLAYFQGLSHREISEELGLPINTVKTRIRDALLRLRSEMVA